MGDEESVLNNMQQNYFKIGVLILVVVFIYIINLNFSRNREANILMFCTKQYDDKATLVSANTYFGNPQTCLNGMVTLIK